MPVVYSDLFYKCRLFRWIRFDASLVYILKKKNSVGRLCVLEISFHLAFAHISHISTSLKLKIKSEVKNSKCYKNFTDREQCRDLEAAEMKAVESIKFNGVLLLACIQSKCVGLVLWGKDLTLPDFKGKDLGENCLLILQTSWKDCFFKG